MRLPFSGVRPRAGTTAYRTAIEPVVLDEHRV
jgi:hypothetical protein